MKIYHFQDYETRLERTKKIIRARKDRRKFIQAVLISAIVTPLFLGLMYHLTIHAYADTPLEGQNLTIDGLIPVNSTTTSSEEIKMLRTDIIESNHIVREWEVERYVCQTFGSDVCSIALSVMYAESHGIKNWTNKNCFYKDGKVHETRVKGALSSFCKKGHEKHAWSEDLGLFQTNTIHSCATKSWRENIDCAYKIYSEAGNKFTPWVTYNSGAYKTYFK